MSSPSPLGPDKILDEAKRTVVSHGTDYDEKGFNGGKRSLAHTVEIFNAITGQSLTERDGWTFMLALKIARSRIGKPKMDSYVDMAGYSGLLGECHLNERMDPPAPTK